mmetsp:Transcript_61457/g.99486  ORF Transcript_61457/g.99486 Transcript_61457/m.99486 type:complete len:114 (-) Transcript_61457:32-373(-)
MQPLAQANGLQVDITHGGDSPGTGSGGGNKGAAAAILATLKRTGGPVVVGWEHVNIQFLTAELGVPKDHIPEWPGSDYDTIYVLKFDSNQKLIFWRKSAQHFPAPEDDGEDVV